MKFNVDKCKVMHLGRGNQGGSYVMNGGTLGVVSEERDLGVRITSDLKASAHCAFVCSRAKQSVGDDRKDSGVQESGRPDETI